MKETIQAIFAKVYVDFGFGEVAPILRDEDVLLESGMDSMGFAILVTSLEEELGYDPFALSEDPTYPATLGQFVEFYESNKP